VKYRSGRLEISPTIGVTLQDPYLRTMLVGATLNFHVADILAIGVWGGYGVYHANTHLTGQITENLQNQPGTHNIPNGADFPQQLGRIDWILSAPQLTLIPLRGKLSLFENIFLDTDLYIFAGLGIVGTRERAFFDALEPGTSNVRGANHPDVIASQTTSRTDIQFTGTFGVGLNFFLAQFLSISVEYRAYPFSRNLSGTDESSVATTCGAGLTCCGNNTCAACCGCNPGDTRACGSCGTETCGSNCQWGLCLGSVDTQNDPKNCGGCGICCPPDCSPTGSRFACRCGQCRDLSNCGPCCSNPNTCDACFYQACMEGGRC
jgi:outer membrane beta-barrel protein